MLQITVISLVLICMQARGEEDNVCDIDDVKDAIKVQIEEQLDNEKSVISRQLYRLQDQMTEDRTELSETLREIRRKMNYLENVTQDLDNSVKKFENFTNEILQEKDTLTDIHKKVDNLEQKIDTLQIITSFGKYRLFNTKKNWSDARQSCKNLNMDLVSFDSNEFDFVRGFIKQHQYLSDCSSIWTAANKHSGQWRWGDSGRAVDEWHHSQPDEDDCGYLYSYYDFELCDKPCSDSYCYMCEV